MNSNLPIKFGTLVLDAKREEEVKAFVPENDEFMFCICVILLNL